MYQNMSTLTELRQKQQLLQQQVQQLELEMEGFSVSTRQYLNTEFALVLLNLKNQFYKFIFNAFQDLVRKEVTECLERCPIEIRGPRAPIRPDDVQPDDSDALKLLPPPLVPQVVSSATPQAQPESSVLDDFAPASQAEALPTVSDFDLFALEQDSGACEDSGPMSLTVQGRVIPCIPCEATTTTTAPPS